jgi:predicted chitinase
MPISEQQLLRILPNAGRQAGVFVPVLNTAMSKYGIVTVPRIAAFRPTSRRLTEAEPPAAEAEL